jgi:NADH:ubiquinone oxidoreductase subunit D
VQAPGTEISVAELNREKARLRLGGVIVLSVGLVSAGVLYWARTRDSNLDQYRDAQARAETRQMQLLYGTSGGLTEDLTNALKRPANQAIIICVVSGLIAAGCFYLGRPFPEPKDPQ